MGGKPVFLENFSWCQNGPDRAGDRTWTEPSQAVPPTAPTLPLSPSVSVLFFLPHKHLIPGTSLGDLTAVTSHPGPSGNSQQHFFVRNLTGEAGGEKERGVSVGGGRGGALGPED